MRTFLVLLIITFPCAGLAQSIGPGGNVIPGGGNSPQSPNFVYAGPSAGTTAGYPTFRRLVNTDLPGAIWAPLASEFGAL